MECGLSYAVVLDSNGRFLQVPNLGYAVGETRTDIVVFEEKPAVKPVRKQLLRWSTIAACLCIMLVSAWNVWQSPIGSVRMQINPDVQMSVNRFDRVVALTGLNEDGKYLIAGYRSYGKNLRAVSDEISDRAIEQGYLKEGGEIRLIIESEHENWKTATQEKLILELDVHLDHRVTVFAEQADETQKEDATETGEQIVILPSDSDAEDGRSGDAEDDAEEDPKAKPQKTPTDPNGVIPQNQGNFEDDDMENGADDDQDDADDQDDTDDQDDADDQDDTDDQDDADDADDHDEHDDPDNADDHGDEAEQENDD